MIQTETNSATTRSLLRSLMPTVGCLRVCKPYPSDRGPVISDFPGGSPTSNMDADAKSAVAIHDRVPAIMDRSGFADGWKCRIGAAYRGDPSRVREAVRFGGMSGPCVSAARCGLWRSRGLGESPSGFTMTAPAAPIIIKARTEQCSTAAL